MSQEIGTGQSRSRETPFMGPMSCYDLFNILIYLIGALMSPLSCKPRAPHPPTLVPQD